MVDDENNFDEARDAIESGLAAGIAELHSEVLEATTQNMREGKDALGNPWPLVTDATLASRQTRTTDPRALVDTAEYKADIEVTSTVDLNAPAGVIGTTKNFARHHEFGAPEAGIPRRPLFGPAGKLAEKLGPELIATEIDTRLEGAGID